MREEIGKTTRRIQDDSDSDHNENSSEEGEVVVGTVANTRGSQQKRKLYPLFEKKEKKSKKQKLLKKREKVPPSEMKPLFVGSHVSIGGGFHSAVDMITSLRGNCFAMFTGSQKMWPKSDTVTIAPDVIQLFQKSCLDAKIDRRKHIVPHASYLINLGSPDEEKLAKSRRLFHVEISKCQQLGIGLYNFHPGSHLKEISEDKCCDQVADSINLEHNKSQGVTILLENTAGQGTNIGYKFEHLRRIIDRVQDKTRIGVCFDTCHAFAAGYDLRTEDACEQTFSEFDDIVGFQYLKAVHLNDSKGTLGCKKDRHENIGKGQIGIECFRYLVNDDRFRDIPMVLETPNNMAAKEIQLLRSLVVVAQTDEKPAKAEETASDVKSNK